MPNKRGINIDVIHRVRQEILEKVKGRPDIDLIDVDRLKTEDGLLMCFILGHSDDHFKTGNCGTKDYQENMDKIVKALLETLIWRNEIAINRLQTTDWPTETIEWKFVQIAEFPVMSETKIVVYRSNKYEKCSLWTSEAIKFWMWTLDRYFMPIFNNGHDIASIFDMRGFRLSNIDFNLTYHCLSLTHRHFPNLVKSTYCFEAPFLIRPFVKLTISALGSTFLKGFKMLDYETAVEEFGGEEFVPAILGGVNPMEGLIAVPTGKRVTVESLAESKGWTESDAQKIIDYISRVTLLMNEY